MCTDMFNHSIFQPAENIYLLELRSEVKRHIHSVYLCAYINVTMFILLDNNTHNIFVCLSILTIC